MRVISRLVTALGALFTRRRADAEFDDELRAFLDESVAAKIAQGMPRVDAERAARIELGSAAAVKDWTRDVGWESRVESVWQDVRYALRMLRRAPGFTAVAVLTVAVGIGTNLAIFTLADGMLFRSLPYGEADQLVLIQGYSRERGLAYNRVLRVTFEHLQAHHTGLAGIAAAGSDVPFTWTGPDGPETITSASGTPNLFDVLQVTPYLGRPLRAGDAELEPRPVMLTFDAWQRRFGSDPSIIGRRLVFDQGTRCVRVAHGRVRDAAFPVPLVSREAHRGASDCRHRDVGGSLVLRNHDARAVAPWPADGSGKERDGMPSSGGRCAGDCSAQHDVRIHRGARDRSRSRRRDPCRPRPQ